MKKERCVAISVGDEIEIEPADKPQEGLVSGCGCEKEDPNGSFFVCEERTVRSNFGGRRVKKEQCVAISVGDEIEIEHADKPQEALVSST